MDQFLTMQEVFYRYPSPEEVMPLVLNGVDLQIEKGSFIAVVGRNGSGKSTAAKQFNAILIPTSGKVFVKEIDTADESRTFEIRQSVGMVFQNPDNQIVATVVEEDVAFAPENLGVPPEEIRSRVDQALETVDMTDYAQHAPHMLSGGQKQRVAIAGVIAMSPECIVLDEPTAMLDPIGRREVMDTIKRLNEEKGITIVLITHHMDEAAQAGRVVVMNEGRILLDGPPKQIFAQVGPIREAGLAAPQTVQLLHELSQAGLVMTLDAISVEECAEQIYEKLTGTAK